MSSTAHLADDALARPFDPTATALLATLLAATVHSNDPVLADVMDQAQPSLDGAWGGSTFEERALIAIARCVAKGSRSSTSSHLRDLLVEFGVNDWTAFVEEVVIPLSGPYARQMASFRSNQSDYRWVDVAELPTPLFPPLNLPPRLLASWTALSSPKRGLLRLRTVTPTSAQVEAAWLDRHQVDFADDWDLGRVDWATIQAEVARAYATRPAQWSAKSIRCYTDALPDPIAHGVRSILFDPISWAGGGADLTNGPHRKLAMQLQGVERTLICTR